MKVLFIGDIREGQTSRMRMDAIRRLGHEVAGVDSATPWLRCSWVNRQVSRRVELGSPILSINAHTLRVAEQFQPELVWCEKQEYLQPETINRLKSGGSIVAHYTPDPYFWLSWKRTRIMDASLEHFNALFYCKTYERTQYESVGVPTYFLPLGFCDSTHKPSGNADDGGPLFGFIGGWEPRRQDLLGMVAKVGGLSIWGNYWNLALSKGYSLRKHLILRQLAGQDSFNFSGDSQLLQCIKGGEVYAEAYAAALSSAKIGIGFLRRVCPDQHTTRSFEIPACSSMLLADRTEEHQELFSEGIEADYFSDETELLEKCKFYARRPSLARRIANSGRQRALRSGYSYVDRMRLAISSLEKDFSISARSR